jgi:hypothetical protein
LFYKSNDTIVLSIIVVACLLQAIYGILQYTDIILTDSVFKIVGSFDNPAGFSACLIVGFVYCFSFFDKKKVYNYIAIGAILIISAAIVLSASRAGIISIIIVTALYVYQKIKFYFTKSMKIKILLISFSIFLIIAISLFLYKKDSATGRLLIWKVTIAMIEEKPFFGWGEGGFSSQYMLQQAYFFENHHGSSFEILADNVLHPFNEYLLLTTEYGIVALSLLGILFLTILKLKGKKYFIYQLTILSILIFACFSYPLRYPFVWLILAYSLAKLSEINYDLCYKRTINFNPLLKVTTIFSLFFLAYFSFRDMQFEYKWKEIAKLSLSGKTKAVIPSYEELHSHWNGNPLFLYNYGAELNYIKEYSKSIDILHGCEEYYNDYDVQLLLGDNYFNLKEWEKAETYYTNASLMCPNRFLPLGQLMNVYDSIGLDNAAMKVAIKICEKPVKIQSTTVFRVRLKARQRLDNIESDTLTVKDLST